MLQIHERQALLPSQQKSSWGHDGANCLLHGMHVVGTLVA